jgi:drug/metabolite transporter (DMT)-like permease
VALLYRALAIGRMSVVAPTTAVCAVVIPVAVSLLLGERPAPLAVLGILLGIVSIVLVSRHQPAAPSHGGAAESWRGRPTGLGTALVSGVAIGFFLLTLAQTRAEAGLWPLVAARVLSVSLFLAVALASRRSLRMPAGPATLAVVAGVIDVLANVLYLLAAQRGPLSLVVTLSSLYPASTVLLARVVLAERLNLWQLSGVGCALAAIVLIVSGSY